MSSGRELVLYSSGEASLCERRARVEEAVLIEELTIGSLEVLASLPGLPSELRKDLDRSKNFYKRRRHRLLERLRELG